MQKKTRIGRKAAPAVTNARRRKGGEPSQPDSGLMKASLFMNGRSQAVRLPKKFRFKGTHVYARKEGNRVILTPVDDRIERLIALMGSSPDFPDRDQPPADPMKPEIKEFFGVSD